MTGTGNVPERMILPFSSSFQRLCDGRWESHGRPIRCVTPATGSFFSERKIFVFDVLRLHDFSDPRNDLGL